MRRTRLAWTVAIVALATATGGAQFGGFGFGRPEQKIVEQFDRDNDGRLNAVERRAARNYLEGQRGRGRRNFFPANVSNGARVVPADIKPPYPATPLYDMATLRTIFIDFPGVDWEDELETFYNTDVEVPASVIVDGKTYDQVGIHFRGNSSYRQVPAGYKRSLNLSFDFVHGKQDLRGYRTLNLLNSHEDPTFLRTALSQEIARDYLPSLKSNYLRVVINGENWGIYVSNQQFNKDFIGEWYPSDDGARWKVPGSPRGRAGLEYWGEQNVAQYKRTFEIKSKDTPKAWADLINLTRVLNETPADKLEAALKPLLDVDEVLKFLAVDIVLTNGDGYWARGSDYSLYQDVGGRFHVFPGDMNETFSEGGRGFGFSGAAPSATLDPLAGLNDPSKPLRSKLLAVPALRTRYLGYVRDIATKWLDWNRIGPLARKYQALIAAEVEADTRKLDAFEEFPVDIEGAQSDLRGYIERRRLYLLSYQR
ncbi:MAG: CotH kinase family protein [Vicinamibacterales bacterium]